jgi:hypothetical protein
MDLQTAQKVSSTAMELYVTIAVLSVLPLEAIQDCIVQYVTELFVRGTIGNGPKRLQEFGLRCVLSVIALKMKKQIS